MNIGTNIKEARILLNFSVEEVAYKLKLGLGTYISIEEGEQTLPFKLLEQIVELFGMSVYDLLNIMEKNGQPAATKRKSTLNLFTGELLDEDEKEDPLLVFTTLDIDYKEPEFRSFFSKMIEVCLCSEDFNEPEDRQELFIVTKEIVRALEAAYILAKK